MAFNWSDHPVVDDNTQPSSSFNWNDHPIEQKAQTQPSELESALRGAGQGASLGFEPAIAGVGSATGNVIQNILNGKVSLQDAIDQYKKTRDSEKSANDLAQKTNPLSSLAGNLVGGAGLAAVTGGAGLLPEAAEGAGLAARLGNAAKVGALAGGTGALGNSVSSGDSLGQTAKNVAGGAATGFVAGPVVEAGFSALKGIPNLGSGLKSFGEDQAEKATGATGAQRRLFKPGTGRALLDTGVVGFGDSQANIADKAADLLDQTGKNIGSITDKLTQQGAGTTKQDLANEIQNRIDQIGSDPAQVQVVKQLQSIKNDVLAGPDTPTLSQSETTKTGFQKLSNYNDPNDMSAKKIVGNVYKEMGENVANATNPEDAKSFTDAKTLYGQLEPAASASEKRAATIAQSPTGGLGDMVSYGVGGAPAVIAKKILMPRVNSSIAASSDALGNAVNGAGAAINKIATVPLNTISGAVGAASNVASNAAKKVSTAIQPLTDNAFGDAAKQLVSTGTGIGMKLGSELAKGIGKDSSQKNAILFSLMQQPQYREALQNHFGDQTESK